MTLSSQQINELGQYHWFCVRTKPKHERLTVRSLRQHDQIEVFAPHIRFRKATRRGSVWFVEALFPGYIFARFCYAEAHRWVRSIPGVLTIVAFGERVAVLDAGIIDRLKAAVGLSEQIVFDPDLVEGDTVRLAGGPFYGLETVVTRLLPSKDRVYVLLKFLGQELEVEISKQQVILARSARDASV